MIGKIVDQTPRTTQKQSRNFLKDNAKKRWHLYSSTLFQNRAIVCQAKSTSSTISKKTNTTKPGMLVTCEEEYYTVSKATFDIRWKNSI